MNFRSNHHRHCGKEEDQPKTAAAATNGAEAPQWVSTSCISSADLGTGRRTEGVESESNQPSRLPKGTAAHRPMSCGPCKVYFARIDPVIGASVTDDIRWPESVV
jgi:hypothetical protein